MPLRTDIVQLQLIMMEEMQNDDMQLYVESNEAVYYILYNELVSHKDVILESFNKYIIN